LAFTDSIIRYGAVLQHQNIFTVALVTYVYYLCQV